MNNGLPIMHISFQQWFSYKRITFCSSVAMSNNSEKNGSRFFPVWELRESDLFDESEKQQEEHRTQRKFIQWYLSKLEFGNVGFCGGRRKTRDSKEKPSKQGKESTTNSTHIWHQAQELNPGHICGRQVLSPMCHLSWKAGNWDYFK